MRTAFAAACCLAIGCAIAAPFAYVPNDDDQVKVIDLATNAVVATIPVGDTPSGVAVHPAGTRVYVTNLGSASVSVIDTATNTVVATVNVCQRPWVAAVSPGGDRVIVPCDSGTTVAVIDTSNNTAQAITAGRGPGVATFNPSGSRFFVTNIDDSNIMAFDASTLGYIATLNLVSAPFATLINPSGTRLYVASVQTLTGAGANVVTVYDLDTGLSVGNISFNAPPTWIAMNPAGTRLYVALPALDQVAVVDTSSHAVLGSIATGSNTAPASLNVHPNGTRLYVQLAQTGDLAVYDTTNLARVATVDYGAGNGAYGNWITPLAGAPGGNIPGPLSGLWWNHDENGWGIHFTQRGNVIFAAWYTYDGSGNPKWYVASNCTLPPNVSGDATAGTCSGALYQVTGPRFFGVNFDPSQNVVSQVGQIQLAFSGTDAGSMSYTVNGQSRTVAIERQVFRTGSVRPVVDFTDLWWNPNESGWGMAITQQYDVMFLAWYVYNDSGQPVWYVASNCAVNSNNMGCSGTLYRTTGPAFGPAFDPSQIHVFEAGTVSLAFSNGNNGTLSYTVGGVSGTKSITRQLF